MEIICKKCGSINEYNIKQNGPHFTAYCNGCDSYIKNISKDNDVKLYFGKYKDYYIKDINDILYLVWLMENVKNLKQKEQIAINKQIQKLTTLL